MAEPLVNRSSPAWFTARSSPDPQRLALGLFAVLVWKLDVQGCSAAGRAEDRDCSAECLDPVLEADDAGTAAGVGAPYAVVAD
jgi:hypothetical protein